MLQFVAVQAGLVQCGVVLVKHEKLKNGRTLWDIDYCEIVNLLLTRTPAI